MERKPIDYANVVPEALNAMLGLERVVRTSDLEPLLLELVKLRASQINGCARRIEMHTTDVRALGEGQERLDLVAAWTEAPSFTGRERAALGWWRYSPASPTSMPLRWTRPSAKSASSSTNAKSWSSRSPSRP